MIVAVMIPIMLGMSALSIEVGHGYVVQIRNQRVADLAALGAAQAYSLEPSQSQLQANALAIAAANGLSATAVTATYIADFEGTGTEAVQVDVRTRVSLIIASIISNQAGYDVLATGVAGLPTRQDAPPCILALDKKGAGIALANGTRIAGPLCSATSNAAVSVIGGSTLELDRLTAVSGLAISGGSAVKTNSVVVDGTVTVAAGSTLTGSQGHNPSAAVDPLANDAELEAMRAQLGRSVAPVKPSVANGDNLTLSWYPTTLSFQGRTATMASGGVWTLPAGTYSFRDLDIGSLALVIEGPSTVSVSHRLSIGGGGRLVIGDGGVSIAAPITLGGNASLSLGAGRHYLGELKVDGGSRVTLGAGDLDVDGGISLLGGGSQMTVGDGAVAVGRSGSRAIELAGGSSLSFGKGAFSADGHIMTAGGTSLTLGATAEHWINGDVALSGAATLGSGSYVIDGAFSNGTGGLMSGRDVTFVLQDGLDLAGGSSFDLRAPSAAPWGVPDVLFSSKTKKPVTLSAGASGQFGGALHFPNAELALTGGVKLSGDCFMLIAASIKLSSGPVAAVNCTSDGATGAAPLTPLRLLK